MNANDLINRVVDGEDATETIDSLDEAVAPLERIRMAVDSLSIDTTKLIKHTSGFKSSSVPFGPKGSAQLDKAVKLMQKAKDEINKIKTLGEK